MQNVKFKSAVLAVQASIKLQNPIKFANATEDPNNPYSNHSETEDSSSEEEGEVDVEVPPSTVSSIHRLSISPSYKKKSSPLRRYKGMLFALLSSLIFSVGALIAKELEHVHPFSISLWKFQGAFLPVLPIIIHKLVIQGKTEKIIGPIWPLNQLKHLGMFSLVLVRTFLSTNSLILHYWSLKYLNIGDALTIAASTPILVTLLARIFLKEKCGVITVIASLFTMVGVVAITRPPLLTGASGFDLNALIGSALATGCMVLAAVSYTVLRYIRKVHYSVSTFLYGLWGSLETLSLALIFQVFSLPSSYKEWGLAATLAGLTFVGQCAIVLAMKSEQAGPVALVRTFDVIFGFALQILIMGLIPDWLSIVGSSIVVLSIVICGFRKWLRGLPVGHPIRSRYRYLMM